MTKEGIRQKAIECDKEVAGKCNLGPCETTWIPVTERLPEEFSKSYLVCLQNGHIDIATKMYDGRLAFICEHDVREAYDTNPIIAWMPLPKPYKQGAEE